MAIKVRRTGALLGSVALALGAVTMTACAPPANKAGDGAGGDHPAATATSATDLGGLDALIAAAKQEGQLNVIALPPDWANYGAIIEAFGDKYGITVNSAQPDAASQDEINAAGQQKGKSTAPDVFDLGQSVALANTATFAPYKVQNWAEIPDRLKDPGGKWVNDYAGFMSIGYDSAKVPTVGSVADLLKPEFKGKVALNGDPTQAGAGFSGVFSVVVTLRTGADLDQVRAGQRGLVRAGRHRRHLVPIHHHPAAARHPRRRAASRGFPRPTRLALRGAVHPEARPIAKRFGDMALHGPHIGKAERRTVPCQRHQLHGAKLVAAGRGIGIGQRCEPRA